MKHPLLGEGPLGRFEPTAWYNEVPASVTVNIAEFSDSALMKAFGQTGLGVFPLPDITEEDVKRQYNARVVGHTDEIRARFYDLPPVAGGDVLGGEVLGRVHSMEVS